MAYKTNEVIKSELEALSVGYDDDMTNAELRELLDAGLQVAGTLETKGEPETENEKPTKKASAQAPEVTMGVGTINDHEKRIFALEQAAK
jgi:hypothetical protein